MKTGEKIRELRKALGLTQEELGRMVGVQKAAINKYETGVVVNLKRPVMLALAKALHVSPLDLFDDEEYRHDTINSKLIIEHLTPDELLILTTYQALPVQGKEYIQQQLLAAQLMYGRESDSISDSVEIGG